MTTELESLQEFTARNSNCWVCDIKRNHPENPGIEVAIMMGAKVKPITFKAIQNWLKERHGIVVEDTNKNRMALNRHASGVHN